MLGAARWVSNNPWNVQVRWRWRGAWRHRDTMLDRMYRYSFSKDAQQTLIVLVTAENDPQKLQSLASTKLPRLLKEDLLPLLYTLLDQGHMQVATKVFHQIKTEPWYKPERKFYRVMVKAFMEGSNYEELDKLIDEMELRGCRLDRSQRRNIMEDCAANKQYDLAFKLFNVLKREADVTTLYWRLIDAMNRSGDFETSLKLEREMSDLDAFKKSKHKSRELVHNHSPWAS